jgi:hypothetical protein
LKFLEVLLFDEGDGFGVKLLNALRNFCVLEVWIFVRKSEALAPVAEIRADDKEISVVLKIWHEDLGILRHCSFTQLSNH